jgi:arylsulfatase A-like enzyme/Flp pilus assembly protein TadD
VRRRLVLGRSFPGLQLFLGLAVASSAGLLVGCGSGETGTGSEPPAATPRAAASPPNLLLVTMDTTRADALGAYGQSRDTTPNIDRLARSGVLFEHVATTNPETLPAHSSIFTGTYPYVHGVRANSGYLLADRNVTLAEVLAAHGYRTGAEVAAPVLRAETRVTQGFEHYRGAESPGVELEVVHYSRGLRTEETKPIRTGADITARGIDFLHETDDGRPFFLWLHYFDAHNPYSSLPRFVRKLGPDSYHAAVATEDFQIGLVLHELRELGLEENTLVVLTADHGEGLDEHGEPSHSFFVYDTTMRVPLVLAGLPSLPRGARIPSLVRTIDIAPTVLDLLGLPPLEDVQGASLVPLIEGRVEDLQLTAYGEATRFASTFGLPVLRCLEQGRWKYIHKVNPELYDVVADPGELHDLARSRPEVVASMSGELQTLLADAPTPRDDAAAAVDARTAEQLMALGYVARGPTTAIHDDPASLELRGPDPSSKAADVQVIATAGGLIRRQSYDDALELLAGLRRRNPTSLYAMSLTAEALMGKQRYPEAIALLRRVRAADPKDREAAYQLAHALAESGGKDEAAELYLTLLGDDACDERVRLEQRDLLQRLHRYDELVRVLADGAQRCPEMASNLNNYAWALATLPEAPLRDGGEAVRVIRGVIARSPEEAPGFLDTLGAALAETGDFDGATRAGTRALEVARTAGAPPAVLSQLEDHLAAYRSRRAVRDPAGDSLTAGATGD